MMRFSDLSSLQQRCISAVVMVAVLLSALAFGKPGFLLLLAAVVAALMLEWWWMINSGGKRLAHRWMLVWPPYILLAGFCALQLYDGFGVKALLWLVLLVAMADTGAYFAGRTLGGPKLAPSISPNKTISGALGGIALAVLTALLFFRSTIDLSTITLVLAAVCIAVASQLGDLFESFSKRVHGVKDSSNLIPGHGGFMDRLDGVLPALPVAWLFLVISS